MKTVNILLTAVFFGLFPAGNLDCLEAESQEDISEEGPAAAEPKTPEELKKEKNAEIHFNRGVDFFKDGMISAALAEFMKSYQEVSQWAVLYNVGVCYYRLGKYDEALSALTQYMEEGGDEIPPERRFAVEKMKIKMAASFGSIIIDYKLPGVRITLDGKTTYETPVKDPVPVAAGIHTIFIFREGHYPELIEVSVSSGDEVKVPLKMELTPLMEAWLTDTGRLQYLGERKKIKKLEIATLSLLGVSAALGISTIVAGSITYKLKQDQNNEIFRCGGMVTSREDCPKAFDLKDKGNTWKWATNGLLAAAGAAAATTVILWAVKRAAQKKILEESHMEIAVNSKTRLLFNGPGMISLTW